MLKALPYLVVTETGTKAYGSSQITESISSIIDQNNHSQNGLVNASQVTWLSNAATNSNVGSNYLLGGYGAQAAGYQIAYSGTLTINPAQLKITAGNGSSLYGTTPNLANVGFSSQGLVNGDTISNVSLSTTATSTSNVNIYAINATNAQLADPGNYKISYIPGTFTINPPVTTPVTTPALIQSFFLPLNRDRSRLGWPMPIGVEEAIFLRNHGIPLTSQVAYNFILRFPASSGLAMQPNLYA